MKLYEVGQVIPKFIEHAEEILFDIADDGAMLLVFFNRPTDEEVNQFKAGTNFEIRFMVIHGVIMITTKIGNLNWMDAPYTPHLSQNLTRFERSDTNQGLALTVYLIDSSTGTIRHMRLLGLSERFTKSLFGAAIEEKMKDFNECNYKNNINRIFAAYPTKDIVKLSKNYCKINE